MDNEHFYKEILESLAEGVYFVDRMRRISYWNHGAEEITGYQREQAVGKCCSDNLLMHVDGSGDVLCVSECPLTKTMADGAPREVEVYLHHADGHRVPVTVRVAPFYDEHGQIIGAVETFSSSVSKLAALEQISTLQRQALIDSLTDVANRRYTETRLQNALAEYQRGGFPFGLLFADIDHFKQVNDTYGHDAGDKALQMVANVFKNNARSFDFVGRWGGEEFVILLSNLKPESLADSANRMRALVERSNYPIGQGMLQVTISIGATLAQTEDNPESLVRRADQLMYQSKAAGRNRVSIG